jgi:hypothetical protein
VLIYVHSVLIVSLQVLSLHVDEVTIAKPSASVKTQLAVYHLQVDDMRSKTSMPVVLQPTDSGTY